MSRFTEILSQFSRQKILVIGDVMLDRYLWCEVQRISPEAPVPVAKMNRESFVLGGAANVAHNLAALNVPVTLFGRVGNDHYGNLLKALLISKKITPEGIMSFSNYPTTTKTRVMCDHYQLLRIDVEETYNLSTKESQLLFEQFKMISKDCSVLIVADYAKGCITKFLAKDIIAYCLKNDIKVICDPTPMTFHKYKQAYLIKPNKKEAEKIAETSIAKDYSNLPSVFKNIQKKLAPKNILITLGEDGMAFFFDGVIQRIPTFAKEVYDVTGAGDTAVATLASGIAAGASLKEAAILANLASGVVVGKLGTAVCTYQELESQVLKYDNGTKPEAGTNFKFNGSLDSVRPPKTDWTPIGMTIHSVKNKT